MEKTTLADLKQKLVRRASRAVVGGFRPPADPFTSWFAKVNFALPGEDWPTSAARPMMPLCQLNLTEVPFRPESISDIAFLTIFIDQEELPTDKANGDGWMLRAYPSLEGLVPIVPPADIGYLKPFPIRWELIEDDFPCWEDAQDNPLASKLEGNYHDFFENQKGTKVGGWPGLIQAGLGIATTQEGLDYRAVMEGNTAFPEYVLQIDSESKAAWSWGDAGFGYIGRGTGAARDVWTLEWQCY
ncbi:MAG: DUF1963 domain-containing protein [Janthinobacterium lividum]